MPFRIELIAGVAAVVIAFGAGWLVNGWRHDAKVARLKEDHAIAVSRAQAEARAEEQRRVSEIGEIANEANRKAHEASADAAVARDAASRLHQELAKLRGRTCYSASTSAGSTTGDPIGVLIDVLTGLESTGRELAEYADQSRIAGLACQQAYESLTRK